MSGVEETPLPSPGKVSFGFDSHGVLTFTNNICRSVDFKLTDY